MNLINTDRQSKSLGGGLYIISAPSGAGKTTLCRALKDRFPDMLYSVSYTTRPPRAGEKNGVDYFFIAKSVFKNGIQTGLWAEWAEVHGNFYGTSLEFLNRGLAAGKDILLDIDVQGTLQMKEKFPECVTIFIMPPSLEVLQQRLEARGTESPQAVTVRIANAKQEIVQKDIYRHIVINDKLSDAVSELVSIVEQYRSGRESDSKRNPLKP